MFIDEAEIIVKAGDGGDGCLSFLREAFRPKGGPDGGDGGHGGDVLLRATEGLDTLLDFAGRQTWNAQDGRHGLGSNCTGRSGDDLVVPVPPGTLVYDAERGNLLADLDHVGATVRIARGGRGGLGNQNFATPSRQSPRISTPGQPGQRRRLRLELKLLADVGLLGRPNAGKSSLLSRVSRARPKVADYPFTTLSPVLGIVDLDGYRRFVMADIPGLIEGAHQGVGLGDGFLRHIERCSLLVHMIDVAPLSGPSPVEAYRQIRAELAGYSPQLAAKPEIIVANKIDLLGPRSAPDLVETSAPALSTPDAPDNAGDSDGWAAVAELQALTGQPVVMISAATGQGLDTLCDLIWSQLRTASEPATSSLAELPPEDLPSGSQRPMGPKPTIQQSRAASLSSSIHTPHSRTETRGEEPRREEPRHNQHTRRPAVPPHLRTALPVEPSR